MRTLEANGRRLKKIPGIHGPNRGDSRRRSLPADLSD